MPGSSKVAIFARADRRRRRFNPLQVAVRAEAVVKARPLQAVAVGHLYRIHSPRYPAPGQFWRTLSSGVLMANRVHPVAQGHV